MKTLTGILVMISCMAAMAQDKLEGKVVEVLAGDMLVVDTRDHGEVKISLSDVDSPEPTQEYGEQAQSYLADLIYKKKIEIFISDKQPDGTYSAVIQYKDRNINQELLEAGLAWVIRQGLSIPPGAEKYLDAEYQAKVNKRGLWGQPRPVAPWDYRRRQQSQGAKQS